MASAKQVSASSPRISDDIPRPIGEPQSEIDDFRMYRRAVTHTPTSTQTRRSRKRVIAMMDKVGLLASQRNRYPHEFSGGQCQRVGIARALILNPDLVVCDEPVSALDVSIQAQVINLLDDLKQEMGLTLVMIAHDLSVVRHISDRVMVMYLGKPMEVGRYDQVFDDAQHPYTKALLSAVPIANPQLARNRDIQLLPGDLPLRSTHQAVVFLEPDAQKLRNYVGSKAQSKQALSNIIFTVQT